MTVASVLSLRRSKGGCHDGKEQQGGITVGATWVTEVCEEQGGAGAGMVQQKGAEEMGKNPEEHVAAG
jgi:hypothetical protein